MASKVINCESVLYSRATAELAQQILDEMNAKEEKSLAELKEVGEDAGEDKDKKNDKAKR